MKEQGLYQPYRTSMFWIFDARGNGGGGETSPTITGDHQNRITDYTAIVVENERILDDGDRTSQCRNYAGGCPTLNTTHEMPILFEESMMGEEMSALVRRLTPLECERLQGFQDGWTDIGEYTDTNGKKKQTSDSARYKALGNSIATPYWFVLLRRIAAQYDRPATLGSLFDGIGGFPLCWERCNGPGTAIWASEIEEFCIAVTKKHFPEGGE